MKATILFYTNCLLPKPMLKESLCRAVSVAKNMGWELIISSHLPIFTDSYRDCRLDFDHLAWSEIDARFGSFLLTQSPSLSSSDGVENFVTGVLSYSPESILTQIVHAIEHSSPDTDAVFLWEHDVLYPNGYVQSMIKAIEGGADYALYHDHIFLDTEGFFRPGVHFWHLSRYAAKKDVLKDHFARKIELNRYEILEPVPIGHTTGEESPSDIVDNVKIVHGDPVVDIRHGGNASGQILVDTHTDGDPLWGDASAYAGLFDDKEYEHLLTSKPAIGYGLFTISSSEIW